MFCVSQSVPTTSYIAWTEYCQVQGDTAEEMPPASNVYTEEDLVELADDDWPTQFEMPYKGRGTISTYNSVIEKSDDITDTIFKAWKVEDGSVEVRNNLKLEHIVEVVGIEVPEDDVLEAIKKEGAKKASSYPRPVTNVKHLSQAARGPRVLMLLPWLSLLLRFLLHAGTAAAICDLFGVGAWRRDQSCMRFGRLSKRRLK